jgi:hypothetical protein
MRCARALALGTDAATAVVSTAIDSSAVLEDSES